jgi:hypothetical protein
MNTVDLLLPKAIKWAEEQSNLILKNGEVLSQVESKMAKAVGVTDPESVRIFEVPSIPLPDNIELRDAAVSAGLFSPTMAGLTLGYGIYIVHGHRTDPLVSHELRHVFQYEQSRSVATFVSEYLAQLMSFGYSNAPMEIDARNHQQS